MQLTCRRCGGEIAVPEAVASQPGATVACPGCGMRYRRRLTLPDSPPTAATPPATEERPTRSLAPPEPTAPTFRDGELVGGRWRIVRFIARGGMGEVYEAEDSELRDRVALKTIHPRAAEQAEAVERFKREIRLARKVTHPNVCRIYDVAYHARPGGAPVIFLTMELLAGETLAARLRRAGRMEPDEALPLLAQMGEALAAAHDAGIVHRDFKSDNVFLVPVGDERRRAVVTDFGIARAASGDSPLAATGTIAGGIVGTPAYMAPEQLEGGQVGPAADLYALGIVAFETVTGALPFQGENAIATAVKRLTEAPPSPRDLVAGLDPRWEEAILRALARDPAARFPSPRDFVAALAASPAAEPGEAASGADSTPAPARAGRPETGRERRLHWIAALALAGLLAAAGSAWWRIRARVDPELPSAVAVRRSVAVLELRNLTGEAESDWLATALAEMLATELAAGGRLRVIGGDDIARARRELGLARGADPDPAGRDRLRALLGADVLVQGSYAAVPGGAGAPLRLDLRLVAADSGELLGALAESGAEAELFALVARAGERAREALGEERVEPRPVAAPTRPEVARLYAEGLERLRAFDAQGARVRLEEAAALDPGNALVRSSLSSAWAALGFHQRAEREAERAFELATGLPDEERLAIEARYREVRRDWNEAERAWGALARAFPDNLDYGLALASVRTAAGRSELALSTLGDLRSLPPPAGDDPRLDLAEAAAAGAVADFRRQREAADRAAAKALAQGARRLQAEARVAAGWAARNLGDLAAAASACGEAEQLYRAAGDRAGEAEALTATGGILFDQGRLAEARPAYDRALAAHRELGDRAAVARALNNLAVVDRVEGERDAARRRYEEALGLCAEIGDRACTAYASHNLGTLLADLGDLAGALARFETVLTLRRDLADPAGTAAALANLGAVLRRQGRLPEARRRLEESLALRREIGQRPGEVGSLNSLGQVLIDQGELAEARRQLETALALAREIGQRNGEAQALAGLGELDLLADDLDGAAGRLAEALALREQIGERSTAAEARLGLARVALERERPEEAAEIAAAALTGLAGPPPPDLATAAATARCRALGERAAAAREACAAAAGATSQSPSVRLHARLAAARLAPPPARRGEAAAVAAEAGSLGLAGLALEARLQEASARPPAERRAAAEPLARDAAGRGYLAIARRARALAAS